MIIKFEIQRVIDGELPAKIDEELSLELQKFNLDIKKDDWLGDKLIYKDFVEDGKAIRYMDTSMRDLKNKCRKYPVSEEEQEVVQNFVKKYNLEVVDGFPAEEIEDL